MCLKLWEVLHSVQNKKITELQSVKNRNSKGNKLHIKVYRNELKG